MDLKLPPQDIDAERCVLGALMLDKDAIIRVADLIKPDDFYNPAHTKIFEAIFELFERNEPIDILSVSKKLKDQNIALQIAGRKKDEEHEILKEQFRQLTKIKNAFKGFTKFPSKE